MVETNQVLELYIAEAAEAAVTGHLSGEEATLEVTTAPTERGITAAGVMITSADVRTRRTDCSDCRG